MKREELEAIMISANGDSGYMYEKDEADSVMDAMEARIKELEEENKHLDDYIDVYQKSEALNIEKLDKKDERIKELEFSYESHVNDIALLEAITKELEENLVEARGVSAGLSLRIKELEQALAMASDPALHPTCADCDKCSTISKLETTQKWISVEDVLPQWGKLVKIKFKDGKEDERRFSADYKWVSKGMQTCESVNVTHWMPLPSAPTTEDSSPIEKENG